MNSSAELTTAVGNQPPLKAKIGALCVQLKWKSHFPVRACCETFTRQLVIRALLLKPNHKNYGKDGKELMWNFTLLPCIPIRLLSFPLGHVPEWSTRTGIHNECIVNKKPQHTISLTVRHNALNLAVIYLFDQLALRLLLPINYFIKVLQETQD